MECTFIYKRKVYHFRSVEKNVPPLDIEMALEMIDEGLVQPSEELLPVKYDEMCLAYLRNFRKAKGRESRLAQPEVRAVH